MLSFLLNSLRHHRRQHRARRVSGRHGRLRPRPLPLSAATSTSPSTSSRPASRRRSAFIVPVYLMVQKAGAARQPSGPDPRSTPPSTCRSSPGSCAASSPTSRSRSRRPRWSTAIPAGRSSGAIAVPLVRPGLATTAILSAIFSWNEFLFALDPDPERGRHHPGLPRRLLRLDGPRLGRLHGGRLHGRAADHDLHAWCCRSHLVRGLTFGAVR